MLFNSLQYLIFFPLVTLTYFMVPQGAARNIVLLAASCVFYMAFIPKYILILFVLIGIDYTAGILIGGSKGSRRKAWLVLSIVANVGMLGAFKYYGFFNGILSSVTAWSGHPYSFPALNLILPLGLSFHTFQSMSYTIDVYRGRSAVQRDLLKYSLYVFFFPQLVAGPIERARHLLPQFSKEHQFGLARAASGGRLILLGLIKKIVIADRLAPLSDRVFDHPEEFRGLVLLLALHFASLQFYCDFSGYSDIARGSARVLGIDLVKNFNRPFAAKSVADLWRRWHISLFTWFRDYVYFPLGGARGSLLRQIIGPLFVFALAGLWHGASWNFVFWGFLQGCLVVGSVAFSRMRSRWKNEAKVHSPVLQGLRGFLAIFLTLNIWSLVNVFFRTRTMEDAWYMLTHFFVRNGATIDTIAVGYSTFDFALAFFFLAAVIGTHLLSERVDVVRYYENGPSWLRWGAIYTGIAAVLVLGKFTGQTFLYFQF